LLQHGLASQLFCIQKLFRSLQRNGKKVFLSTATSFGNSCRLCMWMAFSWVYVVFPWFVGCSCDKRHSNCQLRAKMARTRSSVDGLDCQQLIRKSVSRKGLAHYSDVGHHGWNWHWKYTEIDFFQSFFGYYQKYEIHCNECNDNEFLLVTHLLVIRVTKIWKNVIIVLWLSWIIIFVVSSGSLFEILVVFTELWLVKTNKHFNCHITSVIQTRKFNGPVSIAIYHLMWRKRETK